MFAEFGSIVINKLTYALDRHTQKAVGFVYVDIADAGTGEGRLRNFMEAC